MDDIEQQPQQDAEPVEQAPEALPEEQAQAEAPEPQSIEQAAPEVVAIAGPRDPYGGTFTPSPGVGGTFRHDVN